MVKHIKIEKIISKIEDTNCGLACLLKIAIINRVPISKIEKVLKKYLMREAGLYVTEVSLLLLQMNIRCYSLIPLIYFPELFSKNYNCLNKIEKIRILAQKIQSQRNVTYDSLYKLLTDYPKYISLIDIDNLDKIKKKMLDNFEANYLIANGKCSEMYQIDDEEWRHYALLKNNRKSRKWRVFYDPYEKQGEFDYGIEWNSLKRNMYSVNWLYDFSGALIFVYS